MSTPSLSLLADENIPAIESAFGDFGSVKTLPGRSIDRSHLDGVDVLLTRSVTPINASLLADTSVRFVGSATTGTDHVDRAWLRDAGIAFAHAPGANATSVADYVLAFALRLAATSNASLAGRTAGVVGCGNTGSRVARRLSALGLRVLRNDPPLADEAEARGEEHPYVSLDRVVAEADLISLHTPLTTGGPYPTHHLFDSDVLDRLQPGTWLINTSRGAVVDNAALRDHLTSGSSRLSRVALDVWENEPTPDPDLLRRVDLSTPHVAGYAYDGKVGGTKMIYDALCAHLGVEPTWTPAEPEGGPSLQLAPPDPRLPQTEYLDALANASCNVTRDHRALQGILDEEPEARGAYFSRLRKEYPIRRHMSAFTVPDSAVPDAYRDAVREGFETPTNRTDPLSFYNLE